MQGQPVIYGDFLKLIRAYEEKHKEKMTWNLLIAHIAEMRQINLAAARVYARDLCYMHKIFLNEINEVIIK